MQHAYITIARKLFAGPFWQERRKFSRAEAFLDMIQLARFRDGEVTLANTVVPIKRGQLFGSLTWFQSRWMWEHKMNVSRFFDFLVNDGTIIKYREGGVFVITLLQYEEYNFQPAEPAYNTPAQQTPHGGELVGLIGKDAARMWINGGVDGLLGDKAPIAMDWLKHICQMGKPLRSDAQLRQMVSDFRNNDILRLKEVIKYSINGGYTALYFDFDKNTKHGKSKGHNISEDRRREVLDILKS